MAATEQISPAQARKKLEMLNRRMLKLAQLRKQHGIEKLEGEIDALKGEISSWMSETDTEQIQAAGFHATLIRGAYDARFIGTRDEITGEEGRDVVPLRTILFRKFPKAQAREVWMQVTRRVVSREAVEEAVQSGLLTVDEIAPSFVEKAKKPYIRIFPDK